MEQFRPLTSSPVLFGRDDLLALGGRRLEQARAGRGQFMLFAGEAGIGKTRLLHELARRVEEEGLTVLSGAVFPGDLDLSGGLLIDLGHHLARSERPVWAGIGSSITSALDSDGSGAGDAHRRRRLMVLNLVDQLSGLAAAGPVMLALEDLHWADDLTLEVLAQFARRIPELPVLAVGTFRSDELYPRIPMRKWRARLLSQRLAEEARLRRLTLAEVHSMASLLLGGPIPAARDLVEVLNERSDGIPLHIEELVGATPGWSSAREVSAVPDTLREAILQRRSGLSDESADVAGAAAVIGRSFDLDLLAAVVDRPVSEVAGAVEELIEHAFLIATMRDWYDFRHALIREALESALPLARRRELHLAVADISVARPELGGVAYRSAHYEAAGASALAHVHAVSGAEQAARLSNHREALDLYRRAVRCAPADLGDAAIGALLAARAAEATATDDNATAAEDYARAHDLLAAAGEVIEAVDILPRLVAVRHLLGDGLDARVRVLEDGLAELTAAALPESETAQVRGRLAAGLSAAYMLDRRLDQSIEHGQVALDLAGGAGDDVTEVNTLTTLGAVLVFAGRAEEGWGRMEDGVRRGREQRMEAEAARAYRMLSSCASVLVEYERAEHWLREGIEYAERVELWNHRHYMAAHLGHVLWATGRWTEAAEIAEHAMADGRGGVTTLITAQHVRGFVALGQGELAAALASLEEAADLGRRMGELQRLSPAIWGLAELAVADRRWDEAVALCREGFAASGEVRDAAYLFPYLITGTRALLERGDPLAAGAWVENVSAALLDRSIPGTLPAIDHARGLLQLAAGSTGLARSSLQAARAGWQQRSRVWEGNWAALDLARCAHRSNRAAEASTLLSEVRERATDMGATPLVDAAAELAALVHRQASTEVAWAPLSARELEVARLVAAGLTNREIGGDLHITVKTVGHHVEHILAKLGAKRRAEIASWVAGVGAG